MPVVKEYVARVDGTCGKEQDVIVTFRFSKKDEAIKRILAKARLEKSISRIIFELSFENVSFRLYGSGKAIFRGMQSEDELNKLLSMLLR